MASEERPHIVIVGGGFGGLYAARALGRADLQISLGEKQVDETYQFGMVTGLVKNYYEDGKLLSESYYRGNRQHGLYTSYYPNGEIEEQGE